MEPEEPEVVHEAAQEMEVVQAQEKSLRAVKSKIGY